MVIICICEYWLLNVVNSFGICWNATKVIIVFIGVGIGIDHPINHYQPIGHGHETIANQLHFVWDKWDFQVLLVEPMEYLILEEFFLLQKKNHKSLQWTIYIIINSHKTNN